MAAKKSKRGTSLEPDGEPPVKKLRSADEEERRATLMSPGLSKLGNMNGLRGGRSGEKPAELFRKDLISAMKLPDTEPLQPDDYFLIQDQWRQEWEKGVQVPVNPDNIPVVSAEYLTVNEGLYGPWPFKLPKKLLHSAKDETYQFAIHELHEQQKLAEQVCRYDLDDLDVLWLQSFNDMLDDWGEDPIEEYTMERVIEEIETQCHEEMQVKIKTVEGLGIEYDENVVCDVCRSPDSEDGNEMVFCDNCDICVHQACYGVQTIPEGSWLCRPCALGLRPQCILCPKTGGAMKSTKSGSKWAHVSCALWIPEVSIGCAEKMEPITKISHIPSSRWSLCCSICRDRSGACIQCSVKTCKTALHVTCAFQNNLEMKTILEDDNAEIQLKAYCQKHTRKIRHEGGLSPRKSDHGSPISSPKKPEEMTEEEKTELRSHRLKKLEEEFYTCVEPEKIAKAQEITDSVAGFIYSYWVLKRKSNFNKPLLTPKQEEEDLLLKQQEDSLLARMKMFVHLRQDLERVRNLCYMVNKREKMSRSLQNMKETIFWKQVALLESDPPKSSETRESKLVTTAHKSAEIYDSYDDIMHMARMVDPEIPSEPIVHDLEHIKARPGRPRKESTLMGLEDKSGFVDDDDDYKPDILDSQMAELSEEKMEKPEMKDVEKPDFNELIRRPRVGRPPNTLRKVGRPPKSWNKFAGLPPKMLRRRGSAVSDGDKSVGKDLKDDEIETGEEKETSEEKEIDVEDSPESVPRQVLVEVSEPSNQNDNDVKSRRTRNGALDNLCLENDLEKSVKQTDGSETEQDGPDVGVRSLRRSSRKESETSATDSKPLENDTSATDSKPFENDASVIESKHLESDASATESKSFENDASATERISVESDTNVIESKPLANEESVGRSPVHETGKTEKPAKRLKVGRRRLKSKSPEPVVVESRVKDSVREQVESLQPRRSLRKSEVKVEDEVDVDVIDVEEKLSEKVEKVPSPQPQLKSKEKESHKRTLFKQMDEKPPVLDQLEYPPARVLRSRVSPEAKEVSPAVSDNSLRHISPSPMVVKAEAETESKSQSASGNELAPPELDSESDQRAPGVRRTRASDKRLEALDSEDKHSPKSAEVAPQLSSSASNSASVSLRNTRDNTPVVEDKFTPPPEVNGEERHLRSRHSLTKENGRLSKRKRSNRRGGGGKFEASQLIVGESMKQKVQDRLCRINRPQSPIKNLQHYAQKRITSFFSKNDSSNLSQQAMTPRSKDRHTGCYGNVQNRQENGKRIHEMVHSPRYRRTSSSSHRVTPLKYATDSAKLGSPETRSRRRRGDSELDSDVSNHMFEPVDGEVSIRSSRSTTPDYGLRGNRRELDFSHSIHNLGKKLRGRRGKYSVTPSEVSEDSMETVLDSEDEAMDSVSETSSYTLRQRRSRAMEPPDLASNDSESSHQLGERLRTRHIGSPRQLGSPRS